ncbi:unnamed protein product, partial [Brenthis ino]
MDDIVKQVPSYQLDQEILDARGISMTVEEVAGLPTCKYSEKVQALNLSEDDLAFLRGLRRRIKNRLASQNSRRRSMEHLRRLTRELRAVRACRDDALSERRALIESRTELRESFYLLRNHILQYLKDRSDPTEVPDIDPEVPNIDPPLPDAKLKTDYRDKTIFECRIEKLVQQSVNHIYKESKEKETRVCAKTVFLDSIKCNKSEMEGVLNLCVKEKRKGHGRKQLAPRRIACYTNSDDGVLDLKIKKENQ